MNHEASTPTPRRSRAAVVLEFLGSMNLAITLLVAVAIAAVIGTVLQQNEPYNNYVIKFGSFWFEVFRALGLYDVYSAGWFLVLLGFLLVSTAVCVYRQGPGIIRDMRQYRLGVKKKSLRSFHQNGEWETPLAGEEAAGRAQAFLEGQGFRVRSRADDDHTVVAAMKGSTNRLGYLLSHVSIVVICIGGLLDGNLGLKFGELTGRIAPETRDLPVSQVPDKSVLPADATSFRGSVTLPEGSQADFIFLNLRDGYLVQNLPFTVALDDFRIQHYASGQPKSFESDIVIYDDELEEPLRRTIAVNHPLIYKDYAIYQASFADGGSSVTLRAWSFDRPQEEPLQLEGTINRDLKLMTPRGPMTIELTDFKPYNIFPAPEDDPQGKKFRNYGPAVVFRLRDRAGQAKEYINYQLPITIDGRPFFMSGMRASQGEAYRYLHIPLDSEGSLGRFMRFRALASDNARVEQVAEQQLGDIFGAAEEREQRDQLVVSMANLVGLFVNRGIDAVVARVEESVPEEQRQAVLESYMTVLRNVMGALYVDLLREEGVAVDEGVAQTDAAFFDDAMNAFSLLGAYGAPFYVQLSDFNHVEASGLQITRSPGKDIVYLGCAMLMAGVFFLFYVHHRRLWVWLEPGPAGTRVLFAGAAHRNRVDFEREFERLQGGMKTVTAADEAAQQR